jgi:hypothetical protein
MRDLDDQLVSVPFEQFSERLDKKFNGISALLIGTVQPDAAPAALVALADDLEPDYRAQLTNVTIDLSPPEPCPCCGMVELDVLRHHADAMVAAIWAGRALEAFAFFKNVCLAIGADPEQTTAAEAYQACLTYTQHHYSDDDWRAAWSKSEFAVLPTRAIRPKPVMVGGRRGSSPAPRRTRRRTAARRRGPPREEDPEPPSSAEVAA